MSLWHGIRNFPWDIGMPSPKHGENTGFQGGVGMLGTKPSPKISQGLVKEMQIVGVSASNNVLSCLGEVAARTEVIGHESPSEESALQRNKGGKPSRDPETTGGRKLTKSVAQSVPVANGSVEAEFLGPI